MSEGARSGRLRRELGPFTATLFTAGMMVGIGIFATFGAATEAAGSGILVAILLGGSVALATGISAAQLGVNNPTEGGAFTWARDFDHPTLGFIAGSGYLGKNLVSMSVIALAFATYLGQVIPGLPAHIVAAAGVLAITGLNLFGIHLTSRVLIGLLAVVVALLALYGAAALHAVDAGHLAPILGNKGALGVAAGAAIFFWTWDGFMRMAIMAGEVKQPRRTIPIAIGGGVAIAAVIFVGTGAITLGVGGDCRRARRNSGRPAQRLARRSADGRGARASCLAGDDPRALAQSAASGSRARAPERRCRPRLRFAATDRGRWLVHARLVFHHALRGAPAARQEAPDLADLLLVRHRRLSRADRRDAARRGSHCGGHAGGADGQPLAPPPHHLAPESRMTVARSDLLSGGRFRTYDSREVEERYAG
ncbi:MAG: APC family permease [Chloroflexi bacterium]|nr:MAG: APC family permease [Chloroflexota bacterium]